MKKHLNLAEAMEALNEYKLVKLPEWAGYWFKEGNNIKEMTREGEVVTPPYLESYGDREDWYITDGLRTFGEILPALKNFKPIARKSMPESFIFMQVPSEISKDIILKMQSLPDSVKLILVDSRFTAFEDIHPEVEGISYSNQIARVNITTGSITGYTPTIEDILAEDWGVVCGHEAVYYNSYEKGILHNMLR